MSSGWFVRKELAACGGRSSRGVRRAGSVGALGQVGGLSGTFEQLLVVQAAARVSPVRFGAAKSAREAAARLQHLACGAGHAGSGGSLPNPSINRTSPGKPGAAGYLKR